MDTTVLQAVRKACARMRTQPSMLAKTARRFAKTMNPHDDSYVSDPDFWLDVFLKLDHVTQQALLDDERRHTKAVSAAKWRAVKATWVR
jgi:hypothetical protein